MRLGGGMEEEPLVWYGIVSAKIPCVNGCWYEKTLPVVSVVELSACGSREPPKPYEWLPLFVGFLFLASRWRPLRDDLREKY